MVYWHVVMFLGPFTQLPKDLQHMFCPPCAEKKVDLDMLLRNTFYHLLFFCVGLYFIFIQYGYQQVESMILRPSVWSIV